MDPVLLWTCAVGLSGLFLSAGWHKTAAPAYYRDLISTYTGLPAAAAEIARHGAALGELLVGLLLLLPVSRMAAAWAALGLLVLYTVLIAVSLARGLNMDCGCAGPYRKLKLSPWLLFRNAVLLGLAWLLTRSPSNRATGIEDLLIVVFASAVSVLIYIAFEQLLSNQDRLALLRNR